MGVALLRTIFGESCRVSLQLFGVVCGGRKTRDAVLGFGRAVRKVVSAAACVGFEIEEALVFALQGCQQGEQRDVFVDVSEIACMEGMTVFQLLHTTGSAGRSLACG